MTFHVIDGEISNRRFSQDTGIEFSAALPSSSDWTNQTHIPHHRKSFKFSANFNLELQKSWATVQVVSKVYIDWLVNDLKMAASTSLGVKLVKADSLRRIFETNLRLVATTTKVLGQYGGAFQKARI